MKSKLGTNVRQILDGHSTSFHFLIFLLNSSRDSLFLISAGIFAKSRRVRWMNSLAQLRAAAGSFYVKNLPS